MANKKITQLTALSSAELTDILCVVDASTGTTKKITIQAIRDAIDKNYTESFVAAEGGITITHNLNKRVAVQVVDANGDDFGASFTYDAEDPLNIVTVEWDGLASGTVTCN